MEDGSTDRVSSGHFQLLGSAVLRRTVQTRRPTPVLAACTLLQQLLDRNAPTSRRSHPLPALSSHFLHLTKRFSANPLRSPFRTRLKPAGLLTIHGRGKLKNPQCPEKCCPVCQAEVRPLLMRDHHQQQEANKRGAHLSVQELKTSSFPKW